MIRVKQFAICFLCFLFLNTWLTTEAAPLQDDPNFYVVIGAFSLKKNADNYRLWAKDKGMDANVAWRDSRNLYYVWYYVSSDKPDAVEEVKRVWTVIDDAWVFTGQLNDLAGKPIVADSNSSGQGGRFASGDLTSGNQTSGDQTSGDQTSSNEISSNSGENSTGNQAGGENTSGENTSGETTGEGKNEAEVFVEDENTGNEGLRPSGLTVDQLEEEPEIDEDFKVYVNTTNSLNMQEVIGRLDVLDVVRNRKMTELTAHNLSGVNNPKNGTGAIEIATRFFGFRPFSVQFSITNPETDTTGLVSVIGDSIVVDMPLEPLQHGDLTILWNVLYFKDAAIMRPESQAELNEVLKFMNDNPQYHVVLHGHTNGSNSGKIIHLNKEDTEYFSMNGDHKESNGSAKKLSEERAYTIQQYLMEQGVEADRTSIKGWGGKRMLYEEADPRAFLNVRVEVEVVDPDK